MKTRKWPFSWNSWKLCFLKINLRGNVAPLVVYWSFERMFANMTKKYNIYFRKFTIETGILTKYLIFKFSQGISFDCCLLLPWNLYGHFGWRVIYPIIDNLAATSCNFLIYFRSFYLMHLLIFNSFDQLFKWANNGNKEKKRRNGDIE